MKNVSKALSLMLVFALAFTMVLGVSAYSDETSITNLDAVNTMSTLNVINGYTDGTFQPEKTVTRAEMAKMIYVLKMGGNDDGAAYYKGLPTTLTDIAGHWAEGYIKYCASLGIVSGRGDNKFYPDDTVTGLEAAKMLLIVQGYDATKAGLVGSTWAMKTAALGAESELFENYGPQLDAACPRDFAALLMYNALDAVYMTWDNDANGYVESTKTNETQTLGSKYFDLVSYEGILTSSGEYSSNGTTAGDKYVRMTVEKKNNKINNMGSTKFEYDADATEFVGQYVKLSVGKNDKVLGIFKVSGKNTVVDSNVNLVNRVKNEADKIKVDGITYKLDTTSTVVVDSVVLGNTSKAADGATNMGTGKNQIAQYFTGTESDAVNNANVVRFIDNDGNGKFDLILVKTYSEAYEVKSVKSASFSWNSKTYNFDDVVIDSKVANGDFAIKTTDSYTGDDAFVILTKVSGKATKVGGNEITIDGTKYLRAADVKEYNGTGFTAATAFTVGNKYDLYIYNNVVYVFEKTAVGSTDIAFLTYANGLTIKMTRTDGTVINSSSAAKNYANLVGHLVKYETNDEDEYELTGLAAGTNVGGYKNAVDITGFVKSSKTLSTAAGGSLDVANDASVFIGYDDNGTLKFKRITGSKLKDFSTNYNHSYTDATAGTTNGLALYNNAKDDVEVVVLVNDGIDMPGSAAGKMLAYLLENPGEAEVPGTSDTGISLSIWTEGGNKDIVMKDNTSNAAAKTLVKGDVFTYEEDNSKAGVYKFGEKLTDLVAVTKVYSDTRLKLSGSLTGTHDLDSDCIKLGVSTKDVEGVEDWSFSESETDANGVEICNAYVMLDDNANYSDKKILYIVFDTNNKWESSSVRLDVDANNDATVAADVDFTATQTVRNLTVNSGKALNVEGTLNVTGTVTATGTITVKNGGTLVVGATLTPAALPANITVENGGKIQYNNVTFEGKNSKTVITSAGAITINAAINIEQAAIANTDKITGITATNTVTVIGNFADDAAVQSWITAHIVNPTGDQASALHVTLASAAETYTFTASGTTWAKD